MKYLQKEERLHAAAIDWLLRERGYEQIFEDPDEATNARLDSIGLLDGRPCFIEVKCSIGPSEVGQIESKLSGSFRGHRNPEKKHPQFEAMRSIWNGYEFPLVATIAGKYTTNGLDKLLEMLAARSRDWQFDYEVWKWDEARLVTLSNSRSRDPQVHIPKTKNKRSQRSPPPTIDELRNIAEKRGAIDLFEHAIELGKRQKLKFDRRKESVTMTPKSETGWLSILPDKSSVETGLIFDCAKEIVPYLEEIPLTKCGRGVFAKSRCATRDRDVLTRVFHAAAEAARRKGIS